MAIAWRVLGAPGRDNALWVTVNTGQAQSRLLFDCGDGCPAELPFGEVQLADHLCFSHLHMDHVGGFDSFFRCTFNRPGRPNTVWGPPGTAAVLHHRFRGFLWNLIDGQSATWQVHDVFADRVEARRFELAEVFATAHDDGARPRGPGLFAGPGFTVEALLMDHGTPSVAYVVRETPRVNVDPAKLAALGLKPGPWLKPLRDGADGSERVEVGGRSVALAELRGELLVTTPGESVAYLTDFRLDGPAADRLAEALRGCTTVVCECQYRDADRELARRNYHMTTVQVATLAGRAGVGRLVLFHLSDRYRRDEWPDLLAEARAIFPATQFPPQWALD
jgi:ribonuclease Z